MAKHLFQIAKQHQSQKANGEMCSDAGISADIDWPCSKLMLHNTEAFFNFPAAMVDFNDFLWRIIQIGCYRVKTVIALLISDFIFVQSVGSLAGDFAIICDRNTGNKPFIVGLACPFILLRRRFDAAILFSVDDCTIYADILYRREAFRE